MRTRLGVVVSWGLTVACASSGALAAGRIVVGHDANTLGSHRATANEAQFAVNLADWLSGGNRGNILLVEATTTDTRHDYAPIVESALTSAGFLITVSTRTDWTQDELGMFDAIFASTDQATQAFIDPVVLHKYVQTRGGLYTFSGKGPDLESESAPMNAFLLPLGLRFDVAVKAGRGGYNGIYGVDITSDHPIFAGLTHLVSANGQDIMSLETNANARIIQTTTDGGGAYAVIENVIPSPAGALVLGLSGLALLRRSRR